MLSVVYPSLDVLHERVLALPKGTTLFHATAYGNMFAPSEITSPSFFAPTLYHPCAVLIEHLRRKPEDLTHTANKTSAKKHFVIHEYETTEDVVLAEQEWDFHWSIALEEIYMPTDRIRHVRSYTIDVNVLKRLLPNIDRVSFDTFIATKAADGAHDELEEYHGDFQQFKSNLYFPFAYVWLRSFGETGSAHNIGVVAAAAALDLNNRINAVYVLKDKSSPDHSITEPRLVHWDIDLTEPRNSVAPDGLVVIQRLILNSETKTIARGFMLVGAARQIWYLPSAFDKQLDLLLAAQLRACRHWYLTDDMNDEKFQYPAAAELMKIVSWGNCTIMPDGGGGAPIVSLPTEIGKITTDRYPLFSAEIARGNVIIIQDNGTDDDTDDSEQRASKKQKKDVMFDHWYQATLPLIRAADPLLRETALIEAMIARARHESHDAHARHMEELLTVYRASV